MIADCSRKLQACQFWRQFLNGNCARSAFPGYRHLSLISVGGWWPSASSSSLLVLFHGNQCKGRWHVAIFTQRWIQSATIARYLAEYYVAWWEKAEWPPAGRFKAFPFEGTFRKFDVNINSSACKTFLILQQYKYNCSYTALVTI